MLNKMTPTNFDWYMHSLIFLHTERVILKQQERRGGMQDGEDNNESEGEDNNEGEDEDDTEYEGFEVDRDEVDDNIDVVE